MTIKFLHPRRLLSLSAIGAVLATSLVSSTSAQPNGPDDFKAPSACRHLVRYGISESSYQQTFEIFSQKSKFPAWVDAYNVNGKTFFNLIFSCQTPGAWVARHGLTSSQYQQVFDQLTAQGYRLKQVDSYLSSGQIRYAAVFVKQGGSAWQAHHGQTAAQFQQTFDTLAQQGYYAVNVSPVYYNGQTYVASLFEKGSVGAWVARIGMTNAQYQQYFDENVAAGRKLVYLNGYSQNDKPRFAAIWQASAPPGAWEARHGLTSAGLQNKQQQLTGQGFKAQVITGYQSGVSPRFAALWQQ
jgi:Bacterial tandem repeat domain 1